MPQKKAEDIVSIVNRNNILELEEARQKNEVFHIAQDDQKTTDKLASV